ncbi:MAG: glycosyltransferase [Novosphingobium sp.]
MKKLRVLSIGTLYPNDIAPNFGIFVERQMEAVVRRGDVDLTMVNPLGLPPWPLTLHPRYRPLRSVAREETRKGVPVLRPCFRLLPGLGGRFNAAMVARAVLPLARELHAEAPIDVIDAQFFYPDGPAAMRVAQALGVPLSVKARGADIHLWGSRPGTAQQVVAAGRAADGLLAVSQGLAGDMAALGMPCERITIHRTGLDRARFRPLDRAECRARLGLPADEPLLATVGALIARKGQVFAIEALAQVPGARLAMAGTGPDEAALRARAQELGLADRVLFLGAVPHDDIPLLLNAADLFVLPTASEGLANAWVEALACGTPVVTTDIPGASELITAPAHGRLVARDAGAIADAVRDLLAAPPSRDAVAAGAQGYSWEENAAQLVAHWRRLAGTLSGSLKI